MCLYRHIFQARNKPNTQQKAQLEMFQITLPTIQKPLIVFQHWGLFGRGVPCRGRACPAGPGQMSRCMKHARLQASSPAAAHPHCGLSPATVLAQIFVLTGILGSWILKQEFLCLFSAFSSKRYSLYIIKYFKGIF